MGASQTVKVRAAVGHRPAMVDAHGDLVRYHRITREGVYNEQLKLLVQPGPVTVPLIGYYRRLIAQGVLVKE